MTKLILTFPALIREQVLKVARDIAAKDKTFTYREAFDINEETIKEAIEDEEKADYHHNFPMGEFPPANKVIIENPDKDTAFRRAVWFKNKVHKAIHWEVILHELEKTKKVIL